MVITQLASTAAEQILDPVAYTRRIGQCFATFTYPTRVVALSRPFDMAAPLGRLDASIAALRRIAAVAPLLSEAIAAWVDDPCAPHPSAVWEGLEAQGRASLTDALGEALRTARATTRRELAVRRWQGVAEALERALWKLPWQDEMHRFYTALGARHLRSATYLLLLWPPPEVSPQAIQATLQQTLRSEVRLLDALPSMIRCPYVEQDGCLVPEEPGAPYLTALTSYDMRGDWSLRTLHPLLDATYDVAIAIDIETLPRHGAQRLAEMAHTTATVTGRDRTMKDARGERVALHADYVLHQLPHQALHNVQVSLLVGGDTPEALETNATTTATKLGASLRLMRLRGAQGELVKFFSAAPARAIDVPHKTRNVLSEGVGCAAGVLTYHRGSTTDGLLWGIDAARRSAVFYHLFQQRQAGHMLILGTTGYGKTVYINTITARAAAVEGYRVIGIDDFDNGPRVARAFAPGARCYNLNLQTPLNLCDIVYGADAEGGWLPNQVGHMVGQIAMMLASPVTRPDGTNGFAPMVFDSITAGLLDAALTELYEPLDPDTPLDAMPLLDELIRILASYDEPEAQQLARMIRMRLYGPHRSHRLTTFGACFNRHTAVRWDFDHDITYYNTAGADPANRALLYMQFMGAALRWMRRRRDRWRPTLLVIDEFGHIAQMEAMATMAATIVKVARKYGIALLVADQNVGTFLDPDRRAGNYIWGNTVGKIFFHMEANEARRVAANLPALAPVHTDFITNAGAGQCVAVFRNTVSMLNNELGPQELRMLANS